MFADDSELYRIIKMPKDVEQQHIYPILSGSHRQLESTTEQRDLGIWITPDMGSSLHCHRIASNAN